MAKKFDGDFSEKVQTDSSQISLEQLQIALDKLGLKIADYTNSQNFKIDISDPQKLLENFPNSSTIWIEKLRMELAKLGLKIIEDIDNRRVAKPEETYNSLVALYSAVKS